MCGIMPASLKVARLLLLAGASLDRPASENPAFGDTSAYWRKDEADHDYDGETPLQIAKRKGHVEWRTAIKVQA